MHIVASLFTAPGEVCLCQITTRTSVRGKGRGARVSLLRGSDPGGTQTFSCVLLRSPVIPGASIIILENPTQIIYVSNIFF